jgi:acrylyl-CoA reductase (NADPH)
MSTYRAIVTTGQGPATIQELAEEDLPEGDVTVEVAYSSLNYKDGLAVTGRGKIARSFPMVCGIDLAGTVVASDSPKWRAGDEVIVTGWGLSETHPGGYAERQRVRSEWLMRPPPGLSLHDSMALGTAGLTAALCVLALERQGLSSTPGAEAAGEVLVTGAGGGVGSIAVALLRALGHQVAASTGRPELHDYLSGLGAATIIDRAELAIDSGRPLEKERWAGAVDTVGSTTLATVLRQLRYRGAVACCGLAGGNDLPASVLPFILRGVSLLGIDSVQCPNPLREQAWAMLASKLPNKVLADITTTAPLSKVPELAEQILAGKVRGRVVVDVRT